MESFERELIGEQREEKKTMSGSALKSTYEKVSSKRKRSEKTNSQIDNSKKSKISENTSHFGHTGSLETPSSGENLHTDDKENRSIIDDLLGDHPIDHVINDDPFDAGQSTNHRSVSTPLKILSPNKRVTMETPDKIGFNSPKASPAFKDRITKNLETVYEPSSSTGQNIPQVNLMREINLIDKPNFQRKRLESIPIRPWNGDIHPTGQNIPRVNLMRVEMQVPHVTHATEPIVSNTKTEEYPKSEKFAENQNPSTSALPRPAINKDLFNTPTKSPQKSLQKTPDKSPQKSTLHQVIATPSPTKRSFHQHSESSNM